MRASVHDNFLLSYEVSSEHAEIRLRTEFRSTGRPVERTDVVFSGVEAYHFEHDCFSNILSEIVERPALGLLAEQQRALEEGFHRSGWPRFWGGSPEKASNYVQTHRLNAYELTSSYGISGWVIARSLDYVTGA
jgi:hypothetical protein